MDRIQSRDIEDSSLISHVRASPPRRMPAFTGDQPDARPKPKAQKGHIIMSDNGTSTPTASDPTVLDEFEADLATEETDEDTTEDSLFDALEAAVIDPVPAGVSKYLASQLGYFSAKNTNKRTVDTAKLPASLILVNRPTAQKLTGTDLERAVAKEFAKMVVTFAASRHLASSTAIAGSNVTFRLATPRPPK